MKVAILGMGDIGSALAYILHSKTKVEVVGWDKNASKLPAQVTLQSCLDQADLVIICIPSWNLRGALMSIAPLLSPTAAVVTLTKGIEKENCKTVDQMLAEILPKHAIGILGGPMLASDMLAGRFTAGILATTSAKLGSTVKKLFKGTALHITTSKDVHGAALCGALKNAYTLSLGIAEGLDLGQNAKGVLFSQAMTEMLVIIRLLGGKTKTVLGLAGAGDFYATSSSPHSRNLKVGITLGTGVDGHLESEGFISLHCFAKLIPDHRQRLPLFSCLHQIANEHAAPQLLVDVIFGQPPR